MKKFEIDFLGLIIMFCLSIIATGVGINTIYKSETTHYNQLRQQQDSILKAVKADTVYLPESEFKKMK